MSNHRKIFFTFRQLECVLESEWRLTALVIWPLYRTDCLTHPFYCAIDLTDVGCFAQMKNGEDP
jgi:hypothetical protein